MIGNVTKLLLHLEGYPYLNPIIPGFRGSGFFFQMGVILNFIIVNNTMIKIHTGT